MTEVITNLGDTRCVLISGSLVVDAFLRISGVVGRPIRPGARLSIAGPTHRH
jgi:hypothetical protein